MNILVGYSGTDVSNTALALARDHAKIFNAKVLVMNSMEGGAAEKIKTIDRIESRLNAAKKFIQEAGVECETHQLARGMSPGEDIVQFAQEKEIDLIYVGIKKKSRAQKIILGSTAQFIILKAPCPVVTVK
ncbi:MAG: universal stress protein [Desulfobacterales bacterium]